MPERSPPAAASSPETTPSRRRRFSTATATSSAFSPTVSQKKPPRKAVSFRGRRRSLLHRCRDRSRTGAVGVPTGDVAGPGTATRQLLSHTIRPAQPIQGLRFFVGPKQFDVLQAVDPEFTKAINFGMFRVFCVPLLNALKWVHSYVGNWGWAIIVLTISDQPRDRAAAPQERGVDAQDAGAAAAVESDSGSLRGTEGDRSRSSRR